MSKAGVGFCLLLLIASCSSAKSEWRVTDVPHDEKEWRWCTEEKDGPELHHKGLCYISQECRTRFFRQKCRRLPLFCAWGDLECMVKYDIFNKKIKK